VESEVVVVKRKSGRRREGKIMKTAVARLVAIQ
jgi:hypothetical protein